MICLACGITRPSRSLSFRTSAKTLWSASRATSAKTAPPPAPRASRTSRTRRPSASAAVSWGIRSRSAASRRCALGVGRRVTSAATAPPTRPSRVRLRRPPPHLHPRRRQRPRPRHKSHPKAAAYELRRDAITKTLLRSAFVRAVPVRRPYPRNIKLHVNLPYPIVRRMEYAHLSFLWAWTGLGSFVVCFAPNSLDCCSQRLSRVSLKAQTGSLVRLSVPRYFPFAPLNQTQTQTSRATCRLDDAECQTPLIYLRVNKIIHRLGGAWMRIHNTLRITAVDVEGACSIQARVMLRSVVFATVFLASRSHSTLVQSS
ncbi:hypothetical protein DFH06DRAFT_1475198, partial [Mycena polygramma]